MTNENFDKKEILTIKALLAHAKKSVGCIVPLFGFMIATWHTILLPIPSHSTAFYIALVVLAAIDICFVVGVTKLLKAASRQNNAIKNGDFVILTDRINGTYVKPGTLKKQPTYYILTDTCGRVMVSGNLCKSCNIGDMVYLVFTEGKEKFNSLDSDNSSHKPTSSDRGSRAMTAYLCKSCVISDELRNKIIPYTPVAGEFAQKTIYFRS